MAVTQVLPSPANARVGEVLALPINKVEYQTEYPTAIHFATPVLLDEKGDAEDFVGAKTVNGRPINGGATIQFTLPDIKISKGGTYYLRLDVYRVRDGVGAVHLTDITSAPFTVSA
ncbi:hypothetical protein J3F84DRAFT_159710 [Trichoderma pleuroticola]